MRNLIFLVCLCLPVQALAQAGSGPFGFEAGMTRERLVQIVDEGAIKELDADTLLLSTAPRPHGEFESYALRFFPEKGLLKIIAASKEIPSDAFGNELKSVYKAIKEELTGLYGKPNHTMDLLNNGSIWFGPGDWMTALFKRDRFLACSWIDTPLPDGIQFIRLDAGAKSKEVGFLNITYEFTGLAEYMKAQGSAPADSQPDRDVSPAKSNRK